MAIATFYAVALGIRSTLSFPYLQTLVDCDAPTEVSRSSPDWPGSAHCNDTDTVVGEAQVLRGFCSASDLTIQFVATPIVGRIADSFGRRPVAMYSAIAFALAGFAFVVSAVYESFEWYYLSFIAMSFGGSIGIMMSTQLVDFTHDLD